MKLSPVQWELRFACAAAALAFFLATAVRAQGTMGQPAAPMNGGVDSLQTELHMLTDVQTQKADPQQAKDYTAFYKAADPAKKIQLGNGFLQKYPASPLAEYVDVTMMNLYYAQQDWNNFYRSADNALALKPDDVDVLTTEGWVIPHFYDPSDSDADTRLDKAEKLEKHAIEVIPVVPKPAALSDTQFAALKSQKMAQAHSALGLVYFRREDYDNSAKELMQSMKDNPNPDQADLFVLGVDLQNLKRYSDAITAFDRCAQIPGGVQDRCKESSAAVKQTAQAKQ